MTDEQFSAHCALLRFDGMLRMLEQEMKPLAPEMSMEFQFELECLGKIARSFFTMANKEIFSKAVNSHRKEVGIKG